MTEQDKKYFFTKVEELLSLKEVKRLDEFPQHGKVTRLEHSIYVAYLSYSMCRRLKLKADYDSLIRGALLHDYFLYDWHEKGVSPKWHGFHHPYLAYENARKLFDLNAIETDIIKNHMWPLTLFRIPRHRESVMVCMADKVSAILETTHLDARLRVKLIG